MFHKNSSPSIQDLDEQPASLTLKPITPTTTTTHNNHNHREFQNNLTGGNKTHRSLPPTLPSPPPPPPPPPPQSQHQPIPAAALKEQTPTTTTTSKTPDNFEAAEIPSEHTTASEPPEHNQPSHPHQPMTSHISQNPHQSDYQKHLDEIDMKNSDASLMDSPPSSQPLLSDYHNQQNQHQQPPTTHTGGSNPTSNIPTPTTTNNIAGDNDSLLSPYHPPPAAPSNNTVFRKRVSPASNGLPDHHQHQHHHQQSNQQQQSPYDSMAMEVLSNNASGIPQTGGGGNLGEDHPNSMQLVKKNAEKDASDGKDIKENIDPDEESPKWEDDENETSSQDLLVYYAQNSTMHGIPSIVGSELYPGRHFFWIGVVCVMGVFLGTVIYWQMSDYYDYPTVTSVNIAYVGEDDFPAITVCDLNMFHSAFVQSMRDDYTAYHLTKLTEITGFYHKYSKTILRAIPEPPPGNKSSIQSIEEMMTLINDTLSNPRSNRLYCSWGQYYWELCPVHSTRITELGMCNTIDVRSMTKNGKLPTAIRQGKPNDPPPTTTTSAPPGGRNGRPENMRDQKPQPAVGNAMRGLTFYLDTESTGIPYRLYQYDGFKIILHNPDEEPLPRQSGFVVQGNTTVEVEISKQVKIGLPPPYKAFGSGTCVDTQSSSFKNPLRRFDVYTKEVCENECFIDSVIETCGGCRHFLHPGNESICEIKHLADCFREAEANYYSGDNNNNNNNNNNNKNNNESAQHPHQCFCPMPCQDARYSASVTSTPFKSTDSFIALQDKYNFRLTASLTYIHFYYADPVVTTIEQVPIYSTEGLLGNIGGQIGLFMGFSLITVAETLELIFLLATRGRRIDEHVKRQKSIRIAATSA